MLFEGELSTSEPARSMHVTRRNRTHSQTVVAVAENPLRRALGLFTAVALIASALISPVSAHASRAGTDRIGGRALAEGKIAPGNAPDIDARAGILVDEEGRALWSRGGSVRRPMASTTKMMTALLVLEHADLNRTVTVSRRAANVPYATGLRAGERFTVRQLLELMLVSSSNDAAYALGEHVGGSMPRFVSLMNARALKLGLRNTHFANPHGLDARGHYSTPADLAVIAKTAMEHAPYRRAVKLRSVKLKGAPGRPARMLKSTSKLILGSYPGLEGGKTGFTDGAKFSYVATAERNGVRLTVAVLGASSHASRFTQTRKLLDWGFRNIETRQLASANETVTALPVAADPAVTVPVKLAKGANGRVFRLDGKVVTKTRLPKNLPLPVFEGQRVGTIEVRQGKRVLAQLPAVATTSVASVNETIGAVPVADYIDRSVTVRTTKVDEPVVAFDAGKPVRREVDIDESVAAPVKKGDRLGTIRYEQGDKVLAEVPVIATESVEQPGFVDRIGISFRRGILGLVGGEQAARPAIDTPS